MNHIPGIHDNGPRDHELWRRTLTAYCDRIFVILKSSERQNYTIYTHSISCYDYFWKTCEIIFSSKYVFFSWYKYTFLKIFNWNKILNIFIHNFFHIPHCTLPHITLHWSWKLNILIFTSDISFEMPFTEECDIFIKKKLQLYKFFVVERLCRAVSIQRSSDKSNANAVRIYFLEIVHTFRVRKENVGKFLRSCIPSVGLSLLSYTCIVYKWQLHKNHKCLPLKTNRTKYIKIEKIQRVENEFGILTGHYWFTNYSKS